MIYVLYNPKAGDRNAETRAKELSRFYPDEQMEYMDVTALCDYESFLGKLQKDDGIVICGGDGTLNRFINDTYKFDIQNPVYYYAAGSGNDFLRDVAPEGEDKPVSINGYMKELPTVTVNGKDYKFINGVGYGIDGYCCEVGDQLRLKGQKPNYTAIAIKGLLFFYKPTNATVTVDGVTHTYKKAWLAPTMFGRFYGGGMMPTPQQDRNDPDKGVSVMVLHKSGKLRTLCVFPSIFQGKHVTHESLVAIHRGHDVTVEFDRPVALQIDGETILNVTKYQVKTCKA